MFGGERSMYWIEYKRFICLGSYSRPHIIGIKACWFGLVSVIWNFVEQSFKRGLVIEKKSGKSVYEINNGLKGIRPEG